MITYVSLSANYNPEAKECTIAHPRISGSSDLLQETSTLITIGPATMEKIDLSTNSKKLQAAYDSVVKGDGLATYAVFEVTKSGAADVSGTGSGSLDEFVEEFSDGQVQFGFARVTVPGSDVYKNILLGWCPDNAPAKLRLLFAANFADVARVFSGYHVQITARDTDDLDPEEFLARVGAAAGARYTYHSSGAGSAAASKPVAASKPAPAARPTTTSSASTSSPSSTGPKQTPKPKVFGAPADTSAVVQPAFGAKPSFGSKPPIASKPAFKAAPKAAASSNDNDGWGDEKEVEERDLTKNPLENVPSAYKPTKVNIEELRSQKSDTISSTPKPNVFNNSEDKEPAKETPKNLNDRVKSFNASDDGRLSSLPKPKVSNNVASRYAPSAGVLQPSFGSKPAFGSSQPKKEKPEGVFQVHGNENGLTPAQIWAQKRGKYKVEPSLDEVASEVGGLSIDSKEIEKDEEKEDVLVPQPEPKAQEPIFPKRSLPPRNIEPVLPKRDPIPVPQPAEEEEEEVEEEEEEEEEEAEEEEEDVAVAAPPPALPSREEPKASKSSGASAVAQYDYEKDEDNEVEFVEGDLIVEIDFVDEEWWSGKNARTGEVGVFPAAYVTLDDEQESEQVSAPAPAQSKAAEPSKDKSQSATAEYDYEKEEDNEISFKEGDKIVDIEFIDLDWWSGKNAATGEIGVFPGNYVKLH